MKNKETVEVKVIGRPSELPAETKVEIEALETRGFRQVNAYPDGMDFIMLFAKKS